MTLDQHWDEVRSNAGLPYLPKPTWDESASTAYINLKTHDIGISPKFVADAVAKGLPEETVIKGALEHEVEHHRTHPYDLGLLLLSLDTLKSYGNKAKCIENLFSDIVINLRATLEGRGNHILPLIEATYKDEVMDALYAFQCAALEKQTDGRTVKHTDLVDKLGTVDFYASSRNKRIRALQTFAHIIQEYIPEGTPEPAEYNVGDFSPDDIKRAIRDMQQRGEISPARAQRMLESNGIDNALRERYLNEAAKYPVTVEPIPVNTPAGSYPSEHQEWGVDKPVTAIDPFTSFGMIVPGITQMWKHEEMFTHGAQHGTPDVVICADVSGSMARVKDNSPAAVAAIALAQQYIANGAKVAVITFSDETKVLPATTSIDDIADALLDDREGSTFLSLEKVKEAYDSCTPEPDVHIITDTCIKNIEDVLAFLAGKSAMRRRDLWIIGGKQVYDGITCHHVDKADDIPANIVRWQT